MRLSEWIEMVNDEFPHDELIEAIEHFYESDDNNYATSIHDVDIYDAIEWELKREWEGVKNAVDE